MFTLPILSATELLRHFAPQLQGHCSSEFGEAVLKLDNANGKGEIRALDLQPGFSVITYDITFQREITFKISGEETSPVYFIYCLKGHFHHQYENQATRRKVDELQNVITTGSSATRTIVHIPSEIPLKISVVWILRSALNTANKKRIPRTSGKLMGIIDEIIPGDSYTYFGAFRPRTAEYVKMLIEKPKSGVVGRLINEAAILNILASQLEYYKEDEIPDAVALSKKELDTALQLGTEIVASLEKPHSLSDLAKQSGLNPKKLQSAFRHLYGTSVGNFVRDARLERARELLETSDLNVSETVYAVGLSSRSYFTKAFTVRYGIRPSELIDSSRP